MATYFYVREIITDKENKKQPITVKIYGSKMYEEIKQHPELSLTCNFNDYVYPLEGFFDYRSANDLIARLAYIHYVLNTTTATFKYCVIPVERVNGETKVITEHINYLN